MIQYSPKRSEATLIHVYGTDRSGSTMLDLILGHAPDAFSCGEVSAWFRPYRRHHFHIECPCGQHPCPVWEKIKDVPESIFHATLAKELKVRYIIDSSKDICWLIDAQKWAVKSGLRTINLLIWKDPISLAYSYWKRGREILSWYDTFIKCYGRVMQLGLPFISVRYDDLIENPPCSVEKLCGVLGMPYFDGKERFWEGKYHYLFGSDGVRAQVSARQSHFEVKKDFPREFEEQKYRIQKHLERNEQFNQIMEGLRQADLLHKSGVEVYAEGAYESGAILPFWYYYRTAVRAVRRYIPKSYAHAE